MEDIYRLETVTDYNNLLGVETKYPLVSVIDLSTTQSSNKSYTHLNFGIYAIYFKEAICGQMIYGRNSYDYQEGTLLFISPGQVVKIIKNEQVTVRKGWVLIFHPDLIHGTNLGKHINDYNFFSYEVNEALHISENERKIFFECLSKISYEIDQRIDKYSRKLIVSNIQLLLDYCVRFYDRQFITRESINKGIIEKFEKLMLDYFRSTNPQQDGLPSVGYFADKLNLSSNYFGELVKKETGKTAQEYIHLKIIDRAKNRILEDSKSISEIAYELGFKYPQHFTRMFKKSTGYSPNEYRLLN
ncbi:helix-turn-helix domain-containing protein [Paludibacter jiangxiensis]|uniref:Helix-turn-helix domain-containing protein n=1 Tax=Paludibacter jiangxiensis TaxID=681398 RepID=A0A161LFS4_9BACT|nr:helix-turn-helix domain-containing protein [Paludibacter jiangxiensis]GAT64045.1 helix-turn-helix domain-containing protein [Paludibacter jiangxiensis]